MAATENELGLLHAAVANWLNARIAAGEASAADISNALKMLKDNSITCVVEEGSELFELQKQLAQKGKAKPDETDLTNALNQLDFTTGIH